MNRVLLFTSLKGGVGKTTAAASLAFALSFYQKRVLCVDLDLGVRGLDLSLGAENRPGPDVMEVLKSGASPLENAVCLRENLYFLPAPALRDSRANAAFDQAEVDAFLARCKEEFDFTLLDLPAGGGEWFLPLSKSPQVTTAVVVSTADVISLRAAEQTGYEIRSCGCESVQLILNRCPLDPKKLERGLFDLAQDAAIPVLGVVPEDALATQALGGGIPLSRLPGSAAGRAFWNIAVRLCGQHLPLFSGLLSPKERDRLYHSKTKGV